MKFKSVFHPQVKLELHDSYLWYQSQSLGLGDRFLKEVKKSIALIQESPKIWPKHKNKFHKFVMNHFPYIIFYKVSKNIISIYAIAHTSREPGYWLSREYHNN